MSILKQAEKRKRRVRARVLNKKTGHRLCVTRSNSHISCQIIDIETNVTKATVTTKSKSFDKGSNKIAATRVGEEIAKVAKKLKIDTLIFDRGPYRFHGRVRSVAEAVNAAGIKC